MVMENELYPSTIRNMHKSYHEEMLPHTFPWERYDKKNGQSTEKDMENIGILTRGLLKRNRDSTVKKKDGIIQLSTCLRQLLHEGFYFQFSQEKRIHVPNADLLQIPFSVTHQKVTSSTCNSDHVTMSQKLLTVKENVSYI
ncbi:hypothetical protein STEG23_026368, partial [Scotinomys teguina]